MKEFINKTSRVYLTHDQIFVVEYQDDLVLDVEDIHIPVEQYLAVTDTGNPLKVLIEFPANTIINNDARRFAENRDQWAIAEAIVINSLGQRILFRFYSKFRKHKYPIKSFSNREEALEWLRDR
ncbi:hypothetical protein K6119_02105 [Paracrocinitomix mangrovi]|uniref:DUF7793 family protein n=1 Tax=Paracrocinitomix mangrovi TaxID=2862509 RepID=UPI001C8E9E73|nr:hypothetical protein [Paracrocinitomix mangrovi]UKN02312.1 hypothetical protein K6119_02105 [Paracrocinitomix mangrovi]